MGKSVKFKAMALAVFMRENGFTIHDIMRALVVIGNASKENRYIPEMKEGMPKEKVLNLEEACTT